MSDSANLVSSTHSDRDAGPGGSLTATVIGSPVLWGAAATCLFYASVPVIPMGRASLQRYFCSHPLEYALVGLFCVGLAILASRFLQLGRERRVLSECELPSLTDGDDPIQALETQIGQTPRLRSTMLHQRIHEICSYLRGTKSSAGLESHLKHLSDTAADRLHDSFSLLLTINWAVPIIGFLGTVIGITLAIANVTPEQLDTSLNSVTGGLAVAFDTTTVAMSFSLILVFAYDWIRRSEQRVLSNVDDFSLSQLLPFLQVSADEADPFVRAQTDAAQQLIEKTEVLVHQQTHLWQEAVDGLRERWSETLADQQEQLAAGLNLGVEATLGDHADQLQQMRKEFAVAFDRAAQHFESALDQDRQSRSEREQAAQENFEQVWSRVRDDFAAIIRSHDAHTEDVVDGLAEKLQQWQVGLERNTQSVEAQLERLQQLSDTMLRIADQEQQLLRIEQQLSSNLEAVQAAETFEETLHNLTAAVHLLTARARPKAA